MIVPAYPPDEARGIWVFLEQDDGVLAPVSLELLARARELASESGAELTGLLAGGDIPATETEAAGLDLDRVVSVSHPLLAQFTAEAYAHAVAQVILEQKPDMFLLGATAYGRDLAGRLAVMLRTGLTADCTGLALELGTGLLLGEVSGFGGGVVATIRCQNHRPQMATVRPGVFPEPVLTPRPKASVVRMVVDIPAGPAWISREPNGWWSPGRARVATWMASKPWPWPSARKSGPHEWPWTKGGPHGNARSARPA